MVKSKKGITHILFESQILYFRQIIRKRFKSIPILKDDDELTIASQELNQYFNRERSTFSVKIDLSLPPFYNKTLMVVKKIPYGQYSTYKEIAKKTGNEKAVRAVGTANAKNPIPIIIPCHRVLASNGGIGGYGGGLAIKNYLLKIEGAL